MLKKQNTRYWEVEMACNKENCVCPKTDCENHGNCCKCINNHREKDSLVYCMREIAEKK